MRSRAEQRIREAAADPAERDRSRHRAGGGSGLLRGRVQEGPAAVGRSGRDAAGSAFFDPYVAILDAKRFELVTGDDSPNSPRRTGLLGRDPGRRQVHRADPRERVRRQRRVPVPAARRQLPACRPRSFPRAASRARNSKSRFDRRPGSGPIKQKVKLPANGRRRPLAAPLHHARGHPPHRVQVPRRERAERHRERERTSAVATATAGVAAPGARSTASSRSRATSISSSSPAKKGEVYDVTLLRAATRLAARPDPLCRQRDRRHHHRERRQRRAGQLLPLRRARRPASTRSGCRIT